MRGDTTASLNLEILMTFSDLAVQTHYACELRDGRKKERLSARLSCILHLIFLWKIVRVPKSLRNYPSLALYFICPLFYKPLFLHEITVFKRLLASSIRQNDSSVNSHLVLCREYDILYIAYALSVAVQIWMHLPRDSVAILGIFGWKASLTGKRYTYSKN